MRATKKKSASKPKPKSSEPKLTQTGIDGLDQLVSGGFPPGSIVTLTGETGTGRTTFAMQFLYNGAVKYKEPGIYISFEEPKYLLFRNMQRFKWNLEKLEAEHKLVFIQYPPHEIDHFLMQENVIHELVRELGIKRMVIDSITPLALLYSDEQERRKAFLSLIDKLRKWGCTTLILAGSTESRANTPNSAYGIENLSDGWISLYQIRDGMERKRALEIIKFRGVSHGCKLCPVKLSQTGIKIESKGK
ncbi:MAG: ATPase domain-containing protein [Candidatus Micrarchaeota archaeon]